MCISMLCEKGAGHLSYNCKQTITCSKAIKKNAFYRFVLCIFATCLKNFEKGGASTIGTWF